MTLSLDTPKRPRRSCKRLKRPINKKQRRRKIIKN